jgi:fatty acid desaturase
MGTGGGAVTGAATTGAAEGMVVAVGAATAFWVSVPGMVAAVLVVVFWLDEVFSSSVDWQAIKNEAETKAAKSIFFMETKVGNRFLNLLKN